MQRDNKSDDYLKSKFVICQYLAEIFCNLCWSIFFSKYDFLDKEQTRTDMMRDELLKRNLKYNNIKKCVEPI